MILFKSRTERERITVGKMIDLYCRLQHDCGGELCIDCHSLKNYAFKRLEKCPFGEEKPTCLNCHVHCYKEDQREKIRIVMRFSGPKMLLYHPVLAIMHLIDNKLSKNTVKQAV